MEIIEMFGEVLLPYNNVTALLFMMSLIWVILQSRDCPQNAAGYKETMGALTMITSGLLNIL
jgi:hypothetical protein